jgi:glycerol-3-phosphate acyltransferase PlsX
VLKMLEGVSDTVVRLARYAHKERLAWRLGLIALSSAIDQLKSITDWQQYGGAPLLGFTHPFIKAHGRSNARAVTNAIKVAHKALAGNLCGNIARTMAELDERSHKKPRASTGSDTSS